MNDCAESSGRYSGSASLRQVIEEVLDVLAKERDIVRAAVHSLVDGSDRFRVVGVHGLPCEEKKLRRWLKSAGESVIRDVTAKSKSAINVGPALKAQPHRFYRNGEAVFICSPIFSKQRSLVGAISIELALVHAGHCTDSRRSPSP
jgi:hypothetical protein